jgi:urea transport system permease protein
MAHGEMMIGAYATFWMHEIFLNYLPDGLFNWYFVVSLPVAFLSAAAVGFITEKLVVRHLYGRPLETLLATLGVSLVLIQTIRLFHGDNSAINNPTWLRGGAEVLQNFVLPYNRCFIIVLCVLCLFVIRALMSRTRFGLRVRATVQNRDMADSLGVRTRRVDGMTFALGAGIAGVAGYALTLIGGISPDMGQNYIVDSFLVVVTGGVGEILGTVGAGLGLGMLNKFFEPATGAVWGKVLILAVVVVFIQWRPEGLFPPRGRVADA